MAVDPTALEALRSGAADIVPEGGLEAKLGLKFLNQFKSIL